MICLSVKWGFRVYNWRTVPDIYKPNGWLWERSGTRLQMRILNVPIGGGYLNMAELNLKRANGGQREKMIIFDKDGSLKTSNEYEVISLEACPYRFAGLPYFLKAPNVREIIYCTDGLFDSKTYMVCRSMLYSAGYGETLIGNDRRHFATSELEQIDRYSRSLVFETPRKTEYMYRAQRGKLLQIRE